MANPVIVGQPAFSATVTAPAANIAVGDSATLTATASGGIPPYSAKVVGSLPAGRSLSGLTVSGTYTASGVYPYSLAVTDAAGNSVILPVAVSVAPALATLTLSTVIATAKTGFVATISGRTAGTTLTATSSDGTALGLYSDSVNGTFSTAGSKTITLVEAPTIGAAKTTNITVTVAAIATPTPSPAPTPAPSSGLPTITTQFRVDGGGQSLEEYTYLRGSPYVAAQYAVQLRTEFGFAGSNPVLNYNTKTVFNDGTGGVNSTDYTVRLNNFASGGSALLDINAPAAGYPLTTGNYWWNTVDNTVTTGNSLDTADSPGPLARAWYAGIVANVAAGRGPHALQWSQGEADGAANSDTNVATLYKATLKKLIAYLRTAAGSNTAFGFKMIGRHQVASSNEPIRQIQREVIAEVPYCYRLAEQYAHRLAITGASSADAVLSTSTNVITMSNTSAHGVNGAVEGIGIPEGAYVSALTANTSITLSKLVNGIVTACNPTVNATGQTVYALDNVHLYPGSTAQPFDTAGNTTHNGTDGFYAVAAQAAKNWANIFGKRATPAFGPYISAVASTQGQNTILVSLTHVSGTDITVPNDSQGWRVQGDGSTLTVSSVARTSANTITLTLSGAVTASTVTVQYAFGSMVKAVRTNYIFDNAGYPMQTYAAVSVAAAAAAPTAPSIAVTAGASQNSVAWTDGAANGSAITGHQIWRGSASGNETLLTTVSTASPYVDTGLTNGTAYYYKVKSVNGIGASAFSNEVSGTPASATIFASDALSGTSGTSMNGRTATVGGAWAGYNGGSLTNEIFSTTGDVYHASTSAHGVVAAVSTTANVTVDVDIVHVSSISSDTAGVIARAQSAAVTYYFADYSKTSAAWRIGKFVNGTQTTISTFSATLTAATTYHMTFACIGDTQTLTVNGGLIGSTNDADAALTGLTGKAGIRAGGVAGTDTTGMHHKNFVATYQ